MALENGGSDMVMPVAPMYGGNGNGLGWGGDSWWVILFLFAMMGNGFGGWGGFGGFGGAMGMADGFLPYFYNTQTQNDVNRGFSDLGLANQLTGIQSAVTSGFGDTALGIAGINQNICQTGAGITSAVTNGFAQAEIANNARQIADMQQAFAAQTAVTGGLNNLSAQLAQCCCDNRLATSQTQNVIQTEAAANRYADATNTRDIIDAQTRGNQAILDKLCQLELDGVKAQVDAKNDRIAELTTQLNMANLAASQTAQTAQILAGQAAEVDGVYNRLKNCPVPTTPVYGNTPIYTNGGCGCGTGCGSF